VSWKRDAQTPAVEAELWSSIPQQAAPKLVEVPPEPEPETKPAPPPPKADPGPSAAEIALAREKERKLKEKLEQEQREKEKLALEKKRQQEKLAQDKKAAEEKKKKELEAQKKDKLKEQQEAQKLEKQRQENLKRMAGLAGASGSPNATGTALKSSGPSASYAGRIIGRVKPNIVFTEDIVGNPSAEVEVRTAPDGTIVGRKLLKSSGSRAWDEAVLKALDKTEVLPRDTDGRVPPALVITFRPRD
jgi:colicin import membrane protein